MTDTEVYSAILTELAAVGASPMTGPQREMRAAPVLKQAGVSLPQLRDELAKPELAWNQSKARSLGVSVADWQRALQVARLSECSSVGELQGVIRRAEAAAAMLRAGYRPERSDRGDQSWTR